LNTAASYLVFSDVDETLIRTKSMFDFLDFYLRDQLDPQFAATAATMRNALAALAAQGAPREVGNRLYYTVWAGQHAADVAACAERWFGEHRGDPDFFITSTLAALVAHRAAGADVILISGSFAAPLAPIAAEIGADHLSCAHPQIEAGRYTGHLIGQPVIGEAKRTAVRALLAAYPHINAADCYGYGDHTSDLPMLEEVGHPVVVGHDRTLLDLLPHAQTLAAS